MKWLLERVIAFTKYPVVCWHINIPYISEQERHRVEQEIVDINYMCLMEVELETRVADTDHTTDLSWWNYGTAPTKLTNTSWQIDEKNSIHARNNKIVMLRAKPHGKIPSLPSSFCADEGGKQGFLRPARKSHLNKLNRNQILHTDQFRRCGIL